MTHALTRTAALIAAAFAPAVVLAQAKADDGKVEQITVTASKRPESLLKTSSSVASVGGEAIEERGITQLDDALRAVAGVAVTQGPSGLTPVVRGIGPSLPTNIGGDVGISTNYDGVYNNADIASRTGFYDLARVEVLRGPQGTIYGRNAQGGVINVVSRDPVFRKEGAASIGIGGYGLRQASAVANLPLGQTLAVRLAGTSVRRSGYLSNGQDDNNVDGLRGKLLWKASGDVTLLTGIELTDISGSGPGTVTPFTTPPDGSQPWTSTNPTGQIYERHSRKAWMQLDWKLGFADLTVLPAWQYLSNPQQLQYTSLTRVKSDGSGALWQRSLEARLSSPEGSALRWQAGAYRYSLVQQPTLARGTAVGTGNTVIESTTATTNRDENEATSGGLFGQVTVPVTSSLRAIVGARRSTDSKDAYFTNTNSRQTGDWSNTDGKLGVEFDVMPRAMAYATLATGYRPGGLSPAPNAPGSTAHQVYAPEKLRSLELGWKSELLDRTLRLNASVYQYDYKGYQFSNLTPCGGFQGSTTPCNAPGIFNLTILNFGKVRSSGGEVEADWRITPADRLTVNVALLSSKVDSAETVSVPGSAPIALQGKSLPNTPRSVFDLAYQHDFSVGGGWGIAPRLSLRHSASYYITVPETATTTQGSFTKVDASVTLTPPSADWRLALWTRNAGNEAVKSNAIAGSMALDAPRTWGMTFNADF